MAEDVATADDVEINAESESEARETSDGRTQRSRRAPKWHQDYVMQGPRV